MQDMITMPDGAQVKTLEELREHFDLISVLEHYTSGKLLVWLKSLNCEEADIVADIVADMNPFMPEFEETLCTFFHFPFSLEKMMSAYEKAVKENCAEAQFRLGCCYLFFDGIIISRGVKAITRNRKKLLKGVDLITQAAEQGHPFAQYSLGNYYRHVEKRDDECTIWYQKAADQGYIEALYALGTVESCLQAVKQGHIRARVRLGNFFFYGRGVNQDYGEAVKWYRKAAEQGDMEAQYRLILCYLTGKGVEKDDHAAAEWCAIAGEKDTVPAEFRIGEWYFYGCDSDIEQDFYEAAKWYHRAFAKEDSWPIINKLDLCLAIILGEKLVYKYVESPKRFRGVAIRKYCETYNPNLEYNENVRWLRADAADHGILYYPIFAMSTIPSANPEDDVESLWCWRFVHRMDRRRSES